MGISPNRIDSHGDDDRRRRFVKSFITSIRRPSSACTEQATLDPGPIHHQLLHSTSCVLVFSISRLLHLYVSLFAVSPLGFRLTWEAVSPDISPRLLFSWRSRVCIPMVWYIYLVPSQHYTRHSVHDILYAYEGRARRTGRTRLSELSCHCFVFLHTRHLRVIHCV